LAGKVAGDQVVKESLKLIVLQDLLTAKHAGHCQPVCETNFSKFSVCHVTVMSNSDFQCKFNRKFSWVRSMFSWAFSPPSNQSGEVCWLVYPQPSWSSL